MAEHIITVELTLVVDSLGTKQAFRFATRGFSSKPTDTPPNAVFDARVIDAGEYRRELFSGARVTGLSRPAFGSITLSNHDGALDAWMGYGISGAPVVVRMGPAGGNFPADFATVFTAYAKTPTVDFASVTIPLEDRSVIFDRPIATEVFTGAEAFVVGSPTRKKPLVFGEPGFIPLVLVDPTLLIYYVQANAVDASFLGGARVAYDGGLPLTFAGYYATVADGIATAPAPGTFKVWANNGTALPVGTYPNSLGPCYIRLGSAPTFDLRFGALGLFLENQADPIRRWTFPDLARRAGALDVNASTLAPGSYPATVGNYLIDGDQTYADVMTDSAQATFSAYGFDEHDRFFTFDLRDPDADAGEALAYTFTTHNAKNFRRQAVPGQEKPVRQVNVSAGRTWPGTVAGAATPQDREAFSREPWQLQFTITSDDVLTAHPGAISVDVQMQGTVNATDADKLAWGKKYIELYGGLRELITLECTRFDAATIGVELGAKVQVRMPRFLCASGRNFRVVTKTINLRSRTVTFGLWGGSVGPSDAVLGGGSGTPAVARDYFVTRIPAPEMFAAIAVQSIAIAAIKDIPAPRMRANIAGFSSGAPGLADPLADKVILLIEPTGAGGSTSFIDLSPFANPLTAVGGAQTSTALAPGVPGTTAYFDGVGDRIALNDAATDAVFVPGTGPICLEVLLVAGSLSFDHLVGRIKNTSGGAFEWGFFLDGATSGLFYWGVRGTNQGALRLFWPTALSTAVLAHLTMQRNEAGEWHCWADGVPGTDYQVAPLATSQVFGSVITGTYTNAMNLPANGREPTVGGNFFSDFDGHIRYMRLTLGERYEGGVPFTPPAGVGTSVILAAVNKTLDLRFNGTNGATSTVDSSVYAWGVTLAGGATLSTTHYIEGPSSLLCNGTGGRAVVGPCGGYNSGFGTLRMRVRPISTASDSVLWTQDGGSGSPIKVFLQGGKVGLTYNGLAVPQTVIASSGPTLANNTWALLEIGLRRSGVVGGIPPPDQIELRIDGTAYAWLNWPAGASPVNNSEPITVGANYDGTSGFNGYIDQVEMTVDALA